MGSSSSVDVAAQEIACRRHVLWRRHHCHRLELADGVGHIGVVLRRGPLVPPKVWRGMATPSSSVRGVPIRGAFEMAFVDSLTTGHPISPVRRPETENIYPFSPLGLNWLLTGSDAR